MTTGLRTTCLLLVALVAGRTVSGQVALEITLKQGTVERFDIRVA